MHNLFGHNILKKILFVTLWQITIWTVDLYGLAPHSQILEVSKPPANDFEYVQEKVTQRIRISREHGKYAVGIVAMEMPLSDKDGVRLKSFTGRGGGQGAYMDDVPWALAQQKIGTFAFKPLFSKDVETSCKRGLSEFCDRFDAKVFAEIQVPIGGGTIPIQVLYMEQEGVPVFLPYDPTGHFFVGLYDEPDSLRSYLEMIILSRIPIMIADQLGVQFEAYQFNDWQTALGPMFIKEIYKNKDWQLGHAPASLFITHNLEYQGLFPGKIEYDLADPLIKFLLERDVLKINTDPRNTFPNTYKSAWNKVQVDLFRLTHLDVKHQFDSENGLEFWSSYAAGRHNLMKGAFLYSDKILFVSEGHLAECLTQKRGYGMDGLLQRLRQKLVGLYNGVRKDKNSPAKLKALTIDGFSGELSDDLKAWKDHNKQAIQRKLRLDTSNLNHFVLAIVTRLVKQKGLNVLFTPVHQGGPMLIDALLGIRDPDTGAQLQFVIMGTAGDPRGQEVVDRLNKLIAENGRRKNLVFIEKYDPVLAKQLGAGALTAMMPSIDEPGGIANQEMALLLTPVLVTARGGLNDFYKTGGTPLAPVPGFEIDDDPASVAERMRSAKAIYEAVRAEFFLYVKYPDEYRKQLEQLAQFNPDWGTRIDDYEKRYTEAIGIAKKRAEFVKSAGKIMYANTLQAIQQGDNVEVQFEVMLQNTSLSPTEVTRLFVSAYVHYQKLDKTWVEGDEDILFDTFECIGVDDTGHFRMRATFKKPFPAGRLEFAIRLIDASGERHWLTDVGRNCSMYLSAFSSVRVEPAASRISLAA